MKHGGFDTGVSETIVLFVIMQIPRLNGKRQVMPIRTSEWDENGRGEDYNGDPTGKNYGR